MFDRIKADFSHLSKHPYLNVLKHKTVIVVSELNTTAGMASSVQLNPRNNDDIPYSLFEFDDNIQPIYSTILRDTYDNVTFYDRTKRMNCEHNVNTNEVKQDRNVCISCQSFDRPFIFILIDEEDKIIKLIGSVMSPKDM